MLYTRKGDKGTTKVFDCDQRISKSSIITEALGSLDETNSFIGYCKTLVQKEDFFLPGNFSLVNILEEIQQNFFILQAEVAGADKKISEEKILEIEKIINQIEKELPPIKNFFIPGGSPLSASCDYARTLVRKTERRVVAVSEEGKRIVSEFSLGYLNRLSSFFYACVRWINYQTNSPEIKPNYQ